jgi:hypothetical protein
MLDTLAIQMPWGNGQEDVPWSNLAGGGAISGYAGAVGETGVAAEGRLKCGGKIPVRMSRRSVVCATRAEYRMPWSASVWRRVAPQLQCTLGALWGSMARPRQCRRPAWNSPCF